MKASPFLIQEEIEMKRRDAEQLALLAAKGGGETLYVVSFDMGAGKEYGISTKVGIEAEEFVKCAGKVEAEVPASGDIVWF